MANSGIHANGLRFFLTLSAPTFLDDKHSIFGLVINDSSYPNSRALIDGFKNPANFPTTNESPNTPIHIDSVVISGADLAYCDLDDPRSITSAHARRPAPADPTRYRQRRPPSSAGPRSASMTIPSLSAAISKTGEARVNF